MKTIIIGLTAAVLLAGTAAQAQSAPPIKIGAFASVTGPNAFLGEPTKKTLELFVERINREGGVNGRKLSLVLYDSKTSAKDASSIARRLVDEDGVDLVIGGTSTGETMAALPYLEETKTPFISLAGALVVVEPVKRYTFKTPHTDLMSVEKILQRVQQEKLSRVGLLSGAGGYDQSCRKNAAAAAPRFNVTIVADEQHGNGDTDLTAQLTKIRAANPDAVIYCGAGASSSIAAKNYRQLAMTPKLYMTVGVGSTSYIEGAEGAAEGTRVTGSALLAFADLPPSDPIYAVTKNYVETYEGTFHEAASNFGGYAYDGLMIAVAALRKAGSADKEKVRDAIESLHSFPGVTGIYSFSPDNHLGLSSDALRILEVKGGRYHLVAPERQS
ncbi:ABC transporter substrate-binding protein [Bradyrhizobium sp. NP1]|uniref:ABC transporter substrate-binding protein n=1 Tax=Bradyrhizobium sp. NP1 TaxID=3049772 RepID=UPI0025A5AA45|nr:ABC transporter substrate-binding protein [Bradyrhizobium sp. NP1]WJR80838.1 ABC transporter substrate-binding protein [Bradyrhizobium sp. NP1]